jgi:hypothetical protein
MQISSFLLRLSLVLLVALSFAGCATYSEDLNRGQRMYEENKYENALALWRLLETDTDSLSLNDQARYAYLRGMTDYRLGYRSDSRHWLAIAKATEAEHADGLSVEWKERLEQSLADLNQDVYGGAERFDKSNSSAVEHTTQAPSGSAAPTVPTAPGGVPKRGCHANADCPSGMICDGRDCTPL